MATDCPVCASVASGGRIRLTEDSAALLVALLKTARRESMIVRRVALDNDDPSMSHEASMAVRLMDSTIDEIERTQTEKGWQTSHGQFQRPDEEGASSRSPEGAGGLGRRI
jgi:hypothetical protein